MVDLLLDPITFSWILVNELTVVLRVEQINRIDVVHVEAFIRSNFNYLLPVNLDMRSVGDPKENSLFVSDLHLMVLVDCVNIEMLGYLMETLIFLDWRLSAEILVHVG